MYKKTDLCRFLHIFQRTNGLHGVHLNTVSVCKTKYNRYKKGGGRSVSTFVVV